MSNNEPNQSVAQRGKKNVSMVVSALNEERLIETSVLSFIANSEPNLDNYEIILVNDGSQDQTGAIMERLAAKYPKIKVLHNPKNLGLGPAFLRGLEHASQDYVMFLCGDGGFPGSSLPLVFAKLGQADLIIPYMSNLKAIKTPFRYFLSRTYTKLINLIFGFKLNYYNGLSLYRTRQLKQLKIAGGSFGIQAEMIIKLLKAGCSYVQVEVKGAEEANRSVAFTFSSFLKVAKTLFNLIIEIFYFNPKTVKK
jgi:glycosyltransferase involved in cell wall biosynthesis